MTLTLDRALALALTPFDVAKLSDARLQQLWHALTELTDEHINNSLEAQWALCDAEMRARSLID